MGIAMVLTFLSGCQRETKPQVSAAVVSVVPDILSAEVTISTSNLIEYAYLYYSSNESPVVDPQVIFATGTSGKLIDGNNTVLIRGLEGQTDYSIVFAFKKDAETFFENNLTVELTTAEYVESFTAIETKPDGIKFNIKVPQSVKDAGNALRYNIGSLPMYLSYKYGFWTLEDAQFLINNDQKCTTEDLTIVYDDSNVEVEVTDPWTGEPMTDMLHTPFVPGEPLVFVAGEYALGEAEDNPWGMNQADYFVPLFDYDAYYEYLDSVGGPGIWSIEVDDNGFDEDEYWTGYYTRRHVTLPGPDALDAEVDIQAEMGATKGTITITPDDKVYQYCYIVLDEGNYQMLLPMLDNNEDYLQWFVTSYFGMYQGAATIQGPAKLELTELFWGIEPETDYHLLLTAMGDKTGMTQKFYHKIFTTTAKTLPAPEIEVKAIKNPETGEDSPYDVWFNVKCTNQNAERVMYAANYEREFGMMLNAGYKYSDIVDMANRFTDDEVALINSADGLNVTFSSMPDATTILAVKAYNEEDTPNAVEAGSSAIAKATSIREPDKAKIDSPLFASLLGDWTMSAPVRGTNYNYEQYDAGVQSCKVTVSEGFTYPETLPEDVYDTYEELVGMDREHVDALYEEFKQEVDEFNIKLKGQNRLLCLGFGFDYPETEQHYATSFFKADSAFDLFCSKTYNGYDNESMIIDCGPKWYLEVKEDGTLVAPINTGRMYPMKSTSNAVYLMGLDLNEETMGYLGKAQDGSDFEFPVSVNDDVTSLTVNPFTFNDVPFYAQPMTLNSYGYGNIAGYEIRDVLTLTKGWSEESSETTVTKSSFSAPAIMNNTVKSANGVLAPVVYVAKSKTAFGAMKKYETVVLKKVDFEEGMRNYVRSYVSKD